MGDHILPTRRFGHIDLARGFAILLVILVHQFRATEAVVQLDPITSAVGAYGQMGVQLFFIASALTLCMSQSRSKRGFYIRRLFRIAPLYYCAIVLYALVDFLGYGKTGPYTVGNVSANLFFVHGFVPEAINGVVPGGWSIAAEMTFYAVFPFAFAIADRVNRRWGPAPIAWGALGAFALYVTAWHVIPMGSVYTITRNNIFYYWPPAHVIVFWIGMAAYFLNKRPTLWVDLAGFILPTSAAMMLWGSGYPAAFAIIPGLSALSFVFLINLLARLPERQTIFHAIGRASYSMYVLHFLVVWFVAPVLIDVASRYVPGALVLAITFPITVAIAFAAASLTKMFIEDPGIEWGRRLLNRPSRPTVPSMEVP